MFDVGTLIVFFIWYVSISKTIGTSSRRNDTLRLHQSNGVQQTTHAFIAFSLLFRTASISYSSHYSWFSIKFNVNQGSAAILTKYSLYLFLFVNSACNMRRASVTDKQNMVRASESFRRQGQRRISTERDDRQLLQLCEQDRTERSRELSYECTWSNSKTVAVTMVRRQLSEARHYSYTAKRKPQRTASLKRRRLEFPDDHTVCLAYEEENVIWSDETRFKLFTQKLGHSYDELWLRSINHWISYVGCVTSGFIWKTVYFLTSRHYRHNGRKKTIFRG